ncbi:MAG: hypothetical protein RIQ56_594, partial [Candidatus Parcubacteria bacterium]
VGATLLHVLSSSVIGVALALSFYKSRKKRIVAGFLGIVTACALHAAFNFLILHTSENDLLKTFAVVWVGLVILIGVLEYIKRIHPRRV